MGQDLRELFEEERKGYRQLLKKGHEDRFLKKLETEMPKSAGFGFNFYKISATILVLVSVGIYSYNYFGAPEEIKTTIVSKNSVLEKEEGISLGDLSPDLKKVENYYVANINLELSDLQISEENKTMVDSFMEQLGTLNEEYEILNKELNRIGPNDQTISAIIKNLQLRLQLLQKLKKKINQLKSSKNEQVI
ncbi:hypothetical protein [uncultured Maribacter sp.]|uniref:hypothetical protein n=1 Tax=uncultured Maribacter sp. TaxID=431308 RepID=UPI002604C4A3|nr:hypothetical protein [uncultured Maribacter sp.]